MDEDRKSTALKALQGIIWRDGYLNGDFTGHLYPDVLPALEQWKAQGIDLYVYSSRLGGCAEIVIWLQR